MSKQIWVMELGCGYRWNDEYKVLEWCPMYGDNWAVDDEDWGAVEPSDEVVTYQGKQTTLSEVHKDIKAKLGAV